MIQIIINQLQNLNFMGKLVNYITQLHKSTKRLYIERMQDDKVTCMIEAKKYDFNYWDGDRRFG